MDLKLEGMTLATGRITDAAGTEVGNLDLVTGRAPDQAYLHGTSYRIERAAHPARTWQVVVDGDASGSALATISRRASLSARAEVTLPDGRSFEVAAASWMRTKLTVTDPVTGAQVAALEASTWTGARWHLDDAQLDALGLGAPGIVALWWLAAAVVRESYGVVAAVAAGTVVAGG